MTTRRIALAISTMLVLLFSANATAAGAPLPGDDNPCCRVL